MASIHPNGSGFRVHYTDATGKRGKSPTFPTREQAEGWMRTSATAVEAGNLFELIEAWKKEKPTAYRLDAADRLSAVVARRGWGSAAQLRIADMHAWMAAETERDHAGDVVSESWRQPSRYLLSVLRWAHDVHSAAIDAKVLAWSPDPPPRQPPLPLLTDDQVEAILDCASGYGPRAFAVVDYLAYYGARPITACRLTLRQLDPDSNELIIGNAKHSGGWRHALEQRHVTLWAGLNPNGMGDEPMFPHYREDRPWRIERGRASEIKDWYKNTIGKKLKLGSMNGIYHLKRYAVTALHRAGVSLQDIALFTGHKSLEQLMKYLRSNADLQREALEKRAALPMNSTAMKKTAAIEMPPLPELPSVPNFVPEVPILSM